MTDVKQSGDALGNIILHAASCSMTGLAVGQ